MNQTPEPLSPEPADLPATWLQAIADALAGHSRVLVLGPADVGKSTFCRALLTGAEAGGRQAVLLDCDVGQKLVGPPAAVTLATAAAPGRLSALAFAGTTSPLKSGQRLFGGIGRLLGEAPPGLLVANTGGLLADGGRWLKAAKIAAIRPDLLIAIGQDQAVDAILAEHARIPARRLEPSPLARRKTPGERRRARRQAFRQHFERAGRITLDPGRHLEQRQLVALADAEGRDIALGIVESVEPETGRATILTAAPPGRVDALTPGQVLLDAEFFDRPLPPPDPPP